MIEKISFIVPVYNTKPLFLDKCVSSMLSFDAVKKEIILVDDGSKNEDTLETVKRFENEHDEVHLFRQENGGPGAARNVGLDNAEGDYVCFVDSDDALEWEKLGHCISRINEGGYDPDIVVGSSSALITDMGIYDPSAIKITDVANIKDEEVPHKWVLWAKVFRRSLFEGIRFERDLKFCEDFIFLTKLYEKSEQTLFWNAPIYDHVKNEDSLCNRFNPQASEEFAKAIIAMEENGIEGISNVVIFYYYLKMVLSLQVFNSSNKKSFMQKRAEAKEILYSEPFKRMFDIEKNSDKKFKHKILCWLLDNGFYYTAFLIKNRKKKTG